MPLGGVVTGLLFEDFDFRNDANRINPGQNGPFNLPPNANATLDPNAVPFSINVLDDDEEFDDGFQDDPAGVALNQTLAADVSTVNANGDPVTIQAGAVLEVEFTLRATTPDGEIIDLLFVAVGPGENQGDLFLIVSTAPVPPGVRLDLEFLNDGGGTPYSEIICFAAGTLIDTPGGPKRVETLEVGDVASIAGGGVDEIVWIGQRRVTASEQRAARGLRPVRIARDAFGPALPNRDLFVTQQHRILLSGARAEIMFGEPEVLAPAVALCNDRTIRIVDEAVDIEYFHVMLTGHGILSANGLPAESFFPGPTALATLTPAARAEFEALFPALLNGGFAEAARPILRGYEAQAFLRGE